MRRERGAAVIGVSMGGIEPLQWAVSRPDYMEAVVPVTPAARCSTQTALIFETARRVIELDLRWNDGNYENGAAPDSGMVIALLVQALFGSSAAGFGQRFGSNDDAIDFYDAQSRTLAADASALDWIYRTYAASAHDVTIEFGGELAAAARAIKARTLLPVNTFDQLLPPVESDVVTMAHHIENVKVVDFDDQNGHYAHRDVTGMALIAREITDLLGRVAAGRPGLSGPRYPRHWNRHHVDPDR